MSILLRTSILGLLLTISLNLGLRPENGIWEEIKKKQKKEVRKNKASKIEHYEVGGRNGGNEHGKNHDPVPWHRGSPAHSHSPGVFCS